MYINCMTTDQTKKTKGDSKPRRIRNPEMRRAAILEATLAAFSERGYVRATLRDIARRAGVTHGLVQRHFGSKEDLFLAAVPGTRDWGNIVAPGDAETLPERVATAFAERLEAGTGIDVMVALIRSAASDIESAKSLYATVQRDSAALYGPLLKGEDVETRTELLVALLIGVTFTRHVVGIGPLAEMANEDLKACLANAIRGLLVDRDD
jgi:hypothetical protein